MTPWLFLLVAAAVVQNSLVANLSLFGVHPTLPLVLVVGWTLLRGGREGLVWGMVGGVLFDISSLAPLGTFTVAMLVVAFLTSLTDMLPFQPTLPLAVGLMLLLSLLFHFVAMVMMQSLGWDVAWLTLWPRIFRVVLLDGVLMLLLFNPLRYLARRAGEPVIEWSK